MRRLPSRGGVASSGSARASGAATPPIIDQRRPVKGQVEVVDMSRKQYNLSDDSESDGEGQRHLESLREKRERSGGLEEGKSIRTKFGVKIKMGQEVNRGSKPQ